MMPTNVARVDEQEVERVLEHLRVRLPHLVPLIQAEVHLSQVKLDSLDWVELLCVIDGEFDVRLTEADLRPLETVRALGRLIVEKRGRGDET